MRIVTSSRCKLIFDPAMVKSIFFIDTFIDKICFGYRFFFLIRTKNNCKVAKNAMKFKEKFKNYFASFIFF